MIFDDKPKIDPTHPLYWLEEKILAGEPWGGGLDKEENHKAEHEDMKQAWNMPEDANLILPPAPSVEQGNRCYHILLHVKYWKEMDKHADIVNKVEEQFPDMKLEDIKPPNKTVHGASY